MLVKNAYVFIRSFTNDHTGTTYSITLVSLQHILNVNCIGINGCGKLSTKVFGVNLGSVKFSSRFREFRSHASNTERDLQARKHKYTPP